MAQSLEFSGIVFRRIEDMDPSAAPFTRVLVELYFRHVGTETSTRIEIPAKVVYGPQSTIGQIHADALAAAKEVIAAASDLLAGSDLQRLQTLAAEFAAREASASEPP
jgi:hypothetical protein